ncbi:MAG: hypothetical protein OXD46_13020 [Chloroflexi bacterium]|nr:hypothetical protein [Chloroflexota bacterium]
MKRAFDPAAFVKDIGHDLVRDFGRARQGTTPELVGDGMEQPIRDRLQQILPRGIGVGSGCVIDIYGGTSRQMDVVLYEKEQCPVFCINNSPEATYYPCEGVLAVGEVKSTIGKKELADCFKQIASVKSLRRAFERTKTGQHVGRPYGEYGSASAFGFDLKNTNIGDIFGFIVAEKSRLQVVPSKRGACLSAHYHENVKAMQNDVLCPDVTVFLDGNMLSPFTIDTENRSSESSYIPTRIYPVLPHSIVPGQSESPFAELLNAIWRRHREGLTAHVPLRRYIHYSSSMEPSYTWAVIVNVETTETTAIPSTPTEHLRPDIQLLQKTAVQPPR